MRYRMNIHRVRECGERFHHRFIKTDDRSPIVRYRFLVARYFLRSGEKQ